jgi:Helitron helicase-like domain at N-terminus
MYLLYDVLQLQGSSLGYFLLVKHQKWRSVKDDIASLTVDQLQDAAKAVANGETIENPTIQRLQRDLTTIGMQVPESFSQKLKMRSKIKGLNVRHGMPAYWITVNPSDL